MLSFIPWLILKIIYSNSPSKIKQASQHRGESFKGLQIVVLFIIMEKKNLREKTVSASSDDYKDHFRIYRE